MPNKRQGGLRKILVDKKDLDLLIERRKGEGQQWQGLIINLANPYRIRTLGRFSIFLLFPNIPHNNATGHQMPS
jgi:hypothetical protein